MKDRAAMQSHQFFVFCDFYLSGRATANDREVSLNWIVHAQLEELSCGLRRWFADRWEQIDAE